MRLPFTIDLGRGVFALALAVLLYFVALSETNPFDQRETGYSVPVQVVNVPPGLVVTTSSSRCACGCGATERLQPPAPGQLHRPGRRHRRGRRRQRQLPISASSTDPEVRNVSPDPGNVRLHLEEIREQALPVRVNLQRPGAVGLHRGQPDGRSGAYHRRRVPRAWSAARPRPSSTSASIVSRCRSTAFTRRASSTIDGNDLKDLNLRTTPPAVTVQVPITQQTPVQGGRHARPTQGQPAPGYALQPLEVNPADHHAGRRLGQR